MNNKGFMMAEVVVVSSIIIVVLVALYTSCNKIIAMHNERIDYYDVATLYELATIRDTYKDELSDIGSIGTVLHDDNRLVYYVSIDEITDLIPQNINATFKDYLTYLTDSTEFETEYILIMERCVENNIDNCKYAYLEVY